MNGRRAGVLLSVFALLVSLLCLTACGKQTEKPIDPDVAEQYLHTITASFDTICENEQELTAAVLNGTVPDSEQLISFVTSISEELRVLASLEPPEASLKKVQEEFADASERWDSLQPEILAAITGDKLQLKEVLTRHAFDVIGIFDHIRYGIEALMKNGYAVPESAKTLLTDIQTLTDAAMDSMFH